MFSLSGSGIAGGAAALATFAVTPAALGAAGVAAHPAALAGLAIAVGVGSVAVVEVLTARARGRPASKEQPNRIAAAGLPYGPAPGRAFGGSAASKAALLSSLSAQRAAGAVVREQPDAAWDVRTRLGCPVPCLDTHWAADGHGHAPLDHQVLYETLYGVPPALACLEHIIFNNLPLDQVVEWPARLVESIAPGADLDQVSDRWALWLLTASDSPLAPDLSVYQGVASLYRERVAGNQPQADAWERCRSAVAAGAGGSADQAGIVEAAARAGAAAASAEAGQALAEAAYLASMWAARRAWTQSEASQHADRARAVAAPFKLWAEIRRPQLWLRSAGLAASRQESASSWERMSTRLVEEAAAAT